MGVSASTERISQLTAMGYSVTESRMALEATGGNVQRAAAILVERRRRAEAAAGGVFALRVNHFLRTQRPWQEFFERFLWPEHWLERVETNLVYYRANYAIVAAAAALVHLLAQPGLLVLAAAGAGLHVGAHAWGDTPVPGLERPLPLGQRLAAASLASSLLVSWSGSSRPVLRVVLTAGGLVLAHASFRARSLAARWSFFKESVEKED